ncbi:hypothetical protein [Nostoc sp. TCL240-02]|uniref:hypothetical protein n=1 Tax=Nostoc sp. TCL240-02 TaxID=2572090 RepID=UPI0020C6C80F|nr:hypothetical protein [Nostoc sp. TCL240-02]
MDDAYDKQYEVWSQTQFKAELSFKDQQITFYRKQNLELRSMLKSQSEQIELYKKLVENSKTLSNQSSSDSSHVNVTNTIVVESKAMNESTNKNEKSEVEMNFHAPVTGATGVNKGVININASERQKTLTESAAEIQRLLKQLEDTNPSASEPEQIAYVNLATKPDFKQRAIGALKEGGEVAIEEFFLENKYLKVGKAVIKGWLQGAI